MFSCCVPRSRGSGLTPTRNEPTLQGFRHWLRPQPRSPRPSARRCPKSSLQVVGELEDGLVYTVSLQRVYVSRGPRQGQRWFQRMRDWAFPRYQYHMVRTVSAGPWRKLVEHLVPAFQDGDLEYVNTFLGTYRVFTTPEQVLDWIFHRYGRNFRDRHRRLSLTPEMTNTLSSLLGTWMDQYPEDFLQPSDSPCLKLLVVYAQVHLPGSAFERRVKALLSGTSHPEHTEPDPNSVLSAPELQMPPVPPLGPVPLPAADTGAVPEPGSAPSPPPLTPTKFASEEPEAFPDVAPDSELKVALAQPQVPPTELGPVAALEPDPPSASGGAPAQELQAATSPPGAQVTESGATGSQLDTPVPELEAVPPPPPVPPTQSVPVPILELQPVTSPSAAMALKGETSVTPPPEPPPELKAAPGQATPPEPSCPLPENRLSVEKADLLAFPPELVAEQLTRMDVELFKKVVPYHCLGSIWSWRNKKCKEHMAPTVHATITQYNRVINCVTSTCLGNRSMKLADRARVVEHWIEVARECRVLKNNSSFYAIVYALQSYSILRLVKMWDAVSRDSLGLFRTLSETSSKELHYSQGSELVIKSISKFAALETIPEKVEKQQQPERGDLQGMVPCLRTFLNQFLLLDYAMPEYLDGRKINFDKKRKEYQMVAELQQLQAGCCYDTLVPNEPFRAWFGAVKQLSKNDSYHLSQEIEPSSHLASKSFKAKDLPEGIKHWSKNRQAPESSGSSTSHSSVQLQCGHDFSSRDAADSPPIDVASSSSSEVEIRLDHVPESQEGQETKCGPSTTASSQEPSTVTSASRGPSSPSSSIKPRATLTRHKGHDSRLLCEQPGGDCCIVRVSLDEDNGNNYKSVLVNNQDKASAVIRKAMDKHNLDEDKPEDYKLVEILSEGQMLQIPESENVCDSLDPLATYHILLMKRSTPMDAKVKNRAISALLGMKQKGPTFLKETF